MFLWRHMSSQGSWRMQRLKLKFLCSNTLREWQKMLSTEQTFSLLLTKKIGRPLKKNCRLTCKHSGMIISHKCLEGNWILWLDVNHFLLIAWKANGMIFWRFWQLGFKDNKLNWLPISWELVNASVKFYRWLYTSDMLDFKCLEWLIFVHIYSMFITQYFYQTQFMM